MAAFLEPESTQRFQKIRPSEYIGKPQIALAFAPLIANHRLRAVFLDALVDVLDPSIAHFNKRCTSITQSPTNPKRLIIYFQDGSTDEADIVLGADGLKSSVRNFVLDSKDRRLAFSHTVAYRGLIPWPKLEEAGFKIDAKEHPVCITGPSKVGSRYGPYDCGLTPRSLALHSVSNQGRRHCEHRKLPSNCG